MAKTLQVGFLGAGFTAQTHAQNLCVLPDIRVAAICATHTASAEKLRERLAVDAAVYDSFDQMLNGTPLDALYVCLPPCAHHGQVEKAAARGINLFLEKPIALTVERARSMITAAESTGVVSQVGFHMRFHRTVRRVKELLRDGALGRPTLFTARFWCNMLGNPWWRDVNGSGGQVLEQVIHLYDLGLHLCGPAAGVGGYVANLGHRDADDYTIEDTSVGLVRFANGAAGAITGSNCAVPDRFMSDFRLVCTEGLVDFHTTGDWRDTDSATITRYAGEDQITERVEENANAYAAETTNFINAIRGSETTLTPIREGARAVELVCAVLESARTGGGPVSL